MVAEFLARGGVIQLLPEGKPHSVAVQYLRLFDMEVEALAGLGGAQPRLIFRRKPITLQRLVKLANRHRFRHRLPPFELALIRVN